MTRIETLTGYAAALVTAQMADDGEALSLVLGTLPRPLGRVLPHLLADAATLMRDSAYASVSIAIHRQADHIDVRAAWEGCAADMPAVLGRLHGFEPTELADWVAWAEGVLLDGDESVPPCDHARFLVLTTSLITEEWAGYPPECWQRFLLDRRDEAG
jgi:hypothetical protein